MASQSAAPEISPPPAGPSKGFLRRIFPLLLTFNLAVGVYVLTRTGLKPKKKEEESQIAENSLENKTSQTAPPPPVPAKVYPPITPEEKLELLKWILQEKRKIKTRDPVEKKKLDEEKAFLKEMIKTKNIPDL